MYMGVVYMASKEYWDELFRRFNSMSDEEFARLVKECEKEPVVNFALYSKDGEKDSTNDSIEEENIHV